MRYVNFRVLTQYDYVIGRFLSPDKLWCNTHQQARQVSESWHTMTQNSPAGSAGFWVLTHYDATLTSRFGRFLSLDTLWRNTHQQVRQVFESWHTMTQHSPAGSAGFRVLTHNDAKLTSRFGRFQSLDTLWRKTHQQVRQVFESWHTMTQNSPAGSAGFWVLTHYDAKLTGRLGRWRCRWSIPQETCPSALTSCCRWTCHSVPAEKFYPCSIQYSVCVHVCT